MLRTAHSGLFDAGFYLKCYPDVRRYPFPALFHYCRHGWKEGRNPRPDFDTGFYLKNNPDVAALGINPFAHYIRYGQNEGRVLQIISTPKPDASSAAPDMVAPASRRREMTRKPRQTIPKKPITLYPKIEAEPFDISVVIPTRNAGDGFEYLQEMLVRQKGFRQIEIIVVDSGSSDSTLRIAKEYRNVILTISPEQFSHSYARNLGAQKATGRYILFTVQDALPASDTWLYELYQALKKNDVVAVSCVEAPREDADLFYRVISWNHYRFLDVHHHDRVLALPEDQTPVSLRKNGQLSDIACLISRDLFLRYGFAGDYAEDLDLGIRLIRDGYRLAFLSHPKVLHSHHRPASYYLKRFYVDTLFLASRFPGFMQHADVGIAELSRAVVLAYDVLKSVVESEFRNMPLPSSAADVASRVTKKLHRPSVTHQPEGMDASGHPYLDPDFVLFLKKHILGHAGCAAKDPADETILRTLAAYADLIFEYLSQTCDWIDGDILEDIQSALFKAYAGACGAQIACCHDRIRQQRKETGGDIDQALRQGV